MNHSSNRSLQFSRRHKTCRLSVILIGLSCLLLLAALVAFLHFYRQQTLYSFQIGANCSLLIPMETTDKKINVTLSGPSNIQGAIFMSNNTPGTIAEQEEMMMPSLSGPCHDCSYNFYGEEEAIFLASGSAVNYTFNVSSSVIDDGYGCLANLSFYGNETASFMTNFSATAYTQECLHSGENSVGVVINRTAWYYVRISLLSSVTVNSNAVITKKCYNTTGLTSPTNCHRLTATNPSCLMSDVNKRSYMLQVMERAMIKYTITRALIDDGILFIVDLSCAVVGLFILTVLAVLSFAVVKSQCRRNEETFYDTSIRGEADHKERRSLLSTSGDESDTEDITLSRQQQRIPGFSTDDEGNDSSDEIIKIKERKSQGKQSCMSPMYPTDEGYVSPIDGKKSTQKKASRNDSYMKTVDSTEDEGIGTCTSSDNLHVGLLHSPPPQALLDEMESVIERVKVLPVDSSGLIHHCSQYGVTLIIPEGAVQRSATVWFGACLFNDKFKFEGDYVPATPIVWVYINCELIKPAELYLPHHIDIKSMTQPQKQLFLFKADDKSVVKDRAILFKKDSTDVQSNIIEPHFIKICLCHFCSTCIAHRAKSVPKRYTMARIDEKTSRRDFDVYFCFLFDRHDCKKTFQSHYRGLTVLSYTPFTFDSNRKLQLTFDPQIVPGWKCYFCGTYYEDITEDMVDFYKDLRPGVKEEDAYENLKMREGDRSYPPSFKLRFKYCSYTAQRIRNLSIRLTGANEHVISMIELDEDPTADVHQSILLTPSPDSMAKEKDPLLALVLALLIVDERLKKLWFAFGLILGFTIPCLRKFEYKFCEESKCIREVLLQWREMMPHGSWEIIAATLERIRLTDLAEEIRRLVFGTSSTVAAATNQFYFPEPDDACMLKKAIKDILIDNHSKLCDLKMSLQKFKSKLYSLRLVGADVLSSERSSIDEILGEFKTSLNFKKTVTEVQKHCEKFLSALNSVGGSYADAANTLQREWTDSEAARKLGISFDISYSQ